MALDSKFLSAVKPAIFSVWGSISPDAYAEDNEEAMELTLDADRLALAGYTEANTLVKQAIEEHGWQKTSRFLAKNIPLC